MIKRLSFILFFIFLDQFTKYLIRENLEPHEIIRVIPGINIVHVTNTGAAFGILKGAGNNFFIIITFLAIFLILYLLIKEKKHFLPYSLILSGATGNLLDRIFIGHVTDFIDLYAGRFHWPAFNVADSCLTVGVIILGIQLFLGERNNHVRGKRALQER
ncbi:MAG: signal peptidase II [Thermodesulfovibrionales bacterium]|nr:signal peptidase II [Thermodesulfovibrionales bacterium]